MRKNGFTLVEILVVMAVLAVVGVLILNIFTSTLRGGNKSQIIGVIKQNGQSVLEMMDKTVRGADDVVCVSSDKKTLVIGKKGIYTRYTFIDPAANPAVNGYIQQDNPTTEQTSPAFVNKVCSYNDSIADPVAEVTLTDTSLQTGVSVENGLFTKDESSGFMDQVTIKFDLKPGIGASQAVAGQIDAVTFQTTIQLR